MCLWKYSELDTPLHGDRGRLSLPCLFEVCDISSFHVGWRLGWERRITQSAPPRLQVLWEWTSKTAARCCHTSCSLPQGGSARSSLMRFSVASFTRNVSVVRRSKYCGYVKHSLWGFCCSVRSHLTYMLIPCLLLCGLKKSSRFKFNTRNLHPLNFCPHSLFSP